MLISFNWLARHVDLEDVDLAELVDRFIIGVAEVEKVEEVGVLDGVLVGKVLEVAPIEGARVQRTVVDLGALGQKQIVCGAPNVAAGQWVPVATVGTEMGDFTIGEREVRGVLSSGMICSEAELGVGDDDDGILALDPAEVPEGSLGQRFDEVFALRDTLFEIDNKSLTHRPDCWGHRGIAREVAALLERPLQPLDLEVTYTEDQPLDVQVDDPVGCPRYTAVCLDGVTVRKSPFWLRLLLHRVGVRAISNVVDVTNFVMLDLGNPLHAFDRREVHSDTIRVRRAADGESFTTLDGQARALTTEDLLIADGQRGVALAGIMGGENSEIRDDTHAVILEAACFDASRVRMTSQRLGLRTDSSARFEKSLDPALASDASKAFCRLMQALDPEVRVTSALADIAAPSPEPTVITLRVDRVGRRLGAPVDAAMITRILRGLEFGVTPEGDGDLRVTVPSFRATKDVTIEADLIEEVGRAFGYNNITPVGPAITLARPERNLRKRFERAVRSHMSHSSGFDEVMTYSFDFDPLLTRMNALPDSTSARVTLANPISAEMPALRRDLTPALTGILERNARQEADIRVYEVGRVFHPSATPGPGQLPSQPVRLGALVGIAGEQDGAAGFFALKHTLDGLARAVERAPLTFTAGGVDHPWAHPVRQATLSLEGAAIGALAELHPRTRMALGVSHHAAVFELDLDAWRTSPVVPTRYTALARFPAVYRDYAVVVDGSTPAGSVAAAIEGACPELVREVQFQSVYTGDGVDDGHKSLAWSVTLRHDDRTLTEPEIREAEAQIWGALEREVGGTPRA